jgi:hypothetical protein
VLANHPTLKNAQLRVLECLIKQIPETDLRYHIECRTAIWRTCFADKGERGEVPASSDFLSIYRILFDPKQECDTNLEQSAVTEDSSPANIACSKSQKEQVVTPSKENMEHVTTHRRLFTTTAGFVGLSPQDAKAGDLVVILFGGHVTYILRESVSNRNSTYTLVGDAFVHGIMYGEFNKLYQRQKQEIVKEEQFLIVSQSNIVLN